MPHCSPDGLRALWEGAGLEDVRTGALDVSAAYASLDDLWRPLEAGVAPSGAYVNSLDRAARDALRAEIGRRLRAGDGAFELGARAWYVTGRR